MAINGEKISRKNKSQIKFTKYSHNVNIRRLALFERSFLKKVKGFIKMETLLFIIAIEKGIPHYFHWKNACVVI